MEKRSFATSPPMANPLGLDARVVADGPVARMMIVTVPAGGRVPPHPSNVVVDFVVLAGAGEAIEGAARTAVGEGDVVRFQPGVAHGFEAGDGGLRLLAVKHG